MFISLKVCTECALILAIWIYVLLDYLSCSVSIKFCRLYTRLVTTKYTYEQI